MTLDTVNSRANTEFQNEIFCSVLLLIILFTSPVLLKSAITVIVKVVNKIGNCCVSKAVSFGAFSICVCCVCVICSCAWASVMQRTEKDVWCLSVVVHLAPLIWGLGTRSTPFLLGWLASKLLGPTFAFLNAGLVGTHVLLDFYVGVEDLNQGPHVCT